MHVKECLFSNSAGGHTQKTFWHSKFGLYPIYVFLSASPRPLIMGIIPQSVAAWACQCSLQGCLLDLRSSIFLSKRADARLRVIFQLAVNTILQLPLFCPCSYARFLVGYASLRKEDHAVTIVAWILICACNKRILLLDLDDRW